MRSGRPGVVCGREGLEVVWSDGSSDRFDWSWLRDACPCDGCRADGGRQRRLEITTLQFPVPAPVAVLRGDTLRLDWTGDGAPHRSDWPLDALRSWRCSRPHREPAPLVPTSAGPPLSRRDWEEVHHGGPELASVLAAVVAHGVALISGVPTRPEAVRDIVATFGYVRPTNYGEVFDVRPLVDPSNLANSHVGLGPHTDNPYRSPPPSVQVLHCLRASAAGGETILVDGFAMADELGRLSPESRRLLERWPWTWHWRDAHNELEATAPIIETDPGGGVRQIRFNERSRTPAVGPPEVVPALLAALSRFAVLVADPAGQTRLTLTPGDALIIDNRRVLHGRTGFEVAGGRLLQGAYTDMDALCSRLAVLRRPSPGAAPGGADRPVTDPPVTDRPVADRPVADRPVAEPAGG